MPERRTIPDRRRALFWAAAATLVAFALQAHHVRRNLGGDWSGLFYTGAAAAVPAALAGESPRRAPDAVGFDGQFYHVIAHDPLLRTDAKTAVDNPPLRWRRILVPASAYVISFGRDSMVDVAYFAVILAAVFAGVYWSAAYIAERGLPMSLGVAFLLLPATMISLERMTVDVMVCALAAGAAVHLARTSGWKLYALLAALPLARETGIVVAAALAVSQAASRRYRGAILAAATGIPFLAWAGYVHLRTSSDGTAWFGAPLAGLLARTLDPEVAGINDSWLRTAAQLDYLGVVGVWAAIVLTVIALRRNPRGEIELSCALTVLLFAFLAKADIWSQAYGFARTMSPVLLWLALLAARERRPAYLLPWAMVGPRVWFQIQTLAGW